MVAAVVVVMIPVGVCVISHVPDVRKLFHCGRLLSIEPVQEVGVDRPAILVCSALVNLNCPTNLRLVSGHDVRKVRERLCVVVSGFTLYAYVNVYSATP